MSGQHLIRACGIIYMFIVSLWAVPSAAELQEELTTRSVATELGFAPYCGVHCLYGAMRYLGAEIGCKDLLKPEYISSKDGSSIGELKRAATDYGFYTLALRNLSTRQLCTLDYPMILHVKSKEDTNKYDHYVLYLGCRDGRAVILDPPKPLSRVATRELARRWDGVALIISNVPISTAKVATSGLKVWAIGILAGVTVILALRWLRRRWRIEIAIFPSLRKRMLVSVLQCCCLLAMASLIALGFHTMHDAGFFADPRGISSVIRAHIHSFVEKVGLSEVEERLANGAIVIDSRYVSDYRAGHIKGAINIAVNASDEQRREVMAPIARSHSIVVYCESRGCEYADIVAGELVLDGFTNVAVFKEGWDKWQNKHRE